MSNNAKRQGIKVTTLGQISPAVLCCIFCIVNEAAGGVSKKIKVTPFLFSLLFLPRFKSVKRNCVKTKVDN